jgi:Outer membrane protein beta-barrel domain
LGVRCLLLVTALLALPAIATAQDFGVMESAETINQGNIKLGTYPVFVFQHEADNEAGLGLMAGYGVTDNLDVEGRVAIYQNGTFFGGDVEYWLLRNQPLDLSVRGGLHFGTSDEDEGDAVDILGDSSGDTRGFDLSVIASAPVSPRLELFGALDLGFNAFDVDDAAEEDVDNTFTNVHLVPGIEYAVNPKLDFLAEIGIGLNDDSSNYIAVGIAYYLR